MVAGRDRFGREVLDLHRDWSLRSPTMLASQPRPPVRPSARPPVRPSARPPVRPSARPPARATIARTRWPGGGIEKRSRGVRIFATPRT
jgi:hypothetical protein